LSLDSISVLLELVTTVGIVSAATTPIMASVISTSARVKAFKLLDAPPRCFSFLCAPIL